jgi:hypothetical protein
MRSAHMKTPKLETAVASPRTLRAFPHKTEFEYVMTRGKKCAFLPP